MSRLRNERCDEEWKCRIAYQLLDIRNVTDTLSQSEVTKVYQYNECRINTLKNQAPFFIACYQNFGEM